MNAESVAVLRAELARLADRVEGLEAIQDQVEALADQLSEDSHTRPPHRAEKDAVAWQDLDSDAARCVFNELREWMTSVLVHHPRVGEALRPCWYRHPAVVQVLLDTYAGWNRAYRSPGRSDSVLWALDWSQRHLPHLEQFLARDLAQCTQVRHDPDHVPMPRMDESDVESYIAWWTRDRTRVSEPSGQWLEEAP